MPHISERIKRFFRRITCRQQKHPGITPAAPLPDITTNYSSATGNNNVHQEQSRDIIPFTSPIAPEVISATGRQHNQQDSSAASSPAPPTVPSTSIALKDPSVAGSNHIKQEQSIDNLAATPPAEKSLWDRAYDALATENPKLAKQYDALLAREQMTNPAPNETTHSPLSAPHGLDTRPDRSHRQMQLDNVIQNGLRRMEDNKTTYTIAGHEFDLTGQITKAAKFLEWSKDFVGTAVKNSPEASLAWSAVCLFFPLLTNPTTAAEANQDGFAYVTSRLRYYVALEPMVRRLGQNATVNGELVTETNDHIVDLYKAILDFQLSSVLRFYQSRPKTYLRDIVTLRDWEQTLFDIKTLEDTVKSDLAQISDLAARQELEHLNETCEDTHATMKYMLSVATQQLAILKEQLAAQLAAQDGKLLAKQHKCLQAFWLKGSDNGATYDWYKDRVEDRVEGTCKWFLNHENFQKWLSQESGPLLVSADPGCGKSVLAKYLIDEGLAKQSATICYFFFKDQDQNTVRQALCALLHQLFFQKSALIQHAMELYNKMGANLVQSETFLWTILRDAVRDPQAGPVIFVIDALDECAGSQLSSLTTNLEKLFRDQRLANVKFKVLMTSRPYQQVVNEFYSLQDLFQHIRIPGEEEFEAISQEINSVIQHRVNHLARKHQLSDKIKSSLNSKLLAIDHRTYLWVYLVFNYLDEGLNEGFKKTDEGIDAAIQTLPESVNQAYDQMLNRSKKAEVRNSAKKALCIILAARRPLTLSEMNIAMNLDGQVRGRSVHDLDLEPDAAFKSRLRTLCGLFVHVHLDKIYFFHQTAREFLIQSSAPTTVSPGLQWHHSITTRHAHSVLAEVCMLYLERLNSTDAKAFSEDDSYGAFCNYSVEYWGDHCREAEFEKGSAMVDLALGLCTPDFASHSQWASITSDRYHILPESNTNVLVASRLGLAIVTQLLLNGGADIEAKTSKGWTALIHAAAAGHEASTRLLLENGANVEARDNDGETALMRAAASGHEAITWLLLDKDADVGARNKDGETALMFAVGSVISLPEWSYKADTRLRPVFDTNVGAKHDNGTTTLVYDAISHHEAVLELLDVDAKESWRWPTAIRVGQYVMFAADSRPEAVTRLLLDKGADVEAKDSKGRTALMKSAQFGYEPATRLLLDNDADMEATDNDGWTALIYGATNGNEAIPRLLIENGADVEATDNDGWTALMHGMANDNEAIPRLLIENGADVKARDSEGRTALMIAARLGHEAVTRVLLENGADVEATDNDGWTALMHGTANDNEAIPRLLIENGADVKARDSEGRTALMIAARLGHEAVTRVLLENGADVEARGSEGRTALMCAADFGKEAVLRLLLENGASVRATDNDDRTALMRAAKAGHEPVARLLLENGASVEATDNDGQTALMYAANSGHEAVTRLLFENGASVEATDNEGWTALMFATNSGHEAVTRLLFENGASVEATDNDGWTALMFAANSGHEAVTRLLLEKGASVEAKDNDDWTSLMFAASNGEEAVTRLLLENGASVEATDNDGRTALTDAPETTRRLLLDHGARLEAKDAEE